MRAARLRGEREISADCWADDLVVERINELLKETYTRDEAVKAYLAEALESVLFGTLETDAFGASIHLAKLAALKAADAEAYRWLMAHHDVLQGRMPRTDGLPTDIAIALEAGDIFDGLLMPELAIDYFRDAAQWMDQAAGLVPSARLKATGQIATFEWKSGNIARFPPLLDQARVLLSEGADRPEAAFFQAIAEYEDSQLHDDRAASAIAEAHLAGDATDLLKDHLRGRVCVTCGPELTRVIAETLVKQKVSRAGMSDGFLAEPEFALLILISKSSAIDSGLRDHVSALVDASAGYRLWLDGMRKHRIATRKLTPHDARVLWLLASSLGEWELFSNGNVEGITRYGGNESSNLSTARMLLDPDIPSKRKQAALILDVLASHHAEFGSDARLVVHFDNISRLLQQAGYPLSARVVTENVARLAKPTTQVPRWSSWGGVEESARLRLAQVLGAVHARMARHAFEDRRWREASDELDEAMRLMTTRLKREWQFGNERAVLLYRNMQPALRLSAQLRFLLAINEEATRTIEGLSDRAFADLQFAMLGETALTMQSAARKRIYGSPEIASAIRRRDDAQDRLEQLDALEKALPSKLPWVIEARRRAAHDELRQANTMIEGNLRAPEELVALASTDRSSVEAVLEEDEAIIVLHTGTSNLYGYAIRRNHDPVLYVSKVGSEELSERIARLRREGSSFGVVDLDNANRLYELLLAPAERLLEGVEHLIVIGDGPIPAVPFSMLATGTVNDFAPMAAPSVGDQVRGARPLNRDEAVAASDLARVPWLIRRFPVSLAPSVTAIIAQRNTPASTAARKPFLGVGDPELGGSEALASIELNDAYTRGGSVDIALLGRLAPLPETAMELRSLASSTPTP